MATKAKTKTPARTRVKTRSAKTTTRKARRTRGSAKNDIIQTVVLVAAYEFLSNYIADFLQKQFPTMFSNSQNSMLSPGVIVAAAVMFLQPRVGFLKKYPQLQVVSIAYITKHLMQRFLAPAGTTQGSYVKTIGSYVSPNRNLLALPMSGVSQSTGMLPGSFRGDSKKTVMPSKFAV